MDDLDAGQQPRCEICGTVMHAVDGGYRCRGCGHWVHIPWVEAPRADDLPGIRGG
jgi:tRNA(Ile2) C34 agmatinyltransferase TiaS